MGDVNHEPSMEEILASIKRIIAEDGEGAPAPRRTREPEAADNAPQNEPILELTEPFEPEADAENAAGDAPPPPEPFDAIQPARSEPPAPSAAPLVSSDAEDASRRSLAALAAAAVPPVEIDAIPEDSSPTIEALAREMLRPMLREWLDANLPALVERLVSQEIERIAATRGP